MKRTVGRAIRGLTALKSVGGGDPVRRSPRSDRSLSGRRSVSCRGRLKSRLWGYPRRGRRLSVFITFLARRGSGLTLLSMSSGRRISSRRRWIYILRLLSKPSAPVNSLRRWVEFNCHFQCPSGAESALGVVGYISRLLSKPSGRRISSRRRWVEFFRSIINCHFHFPMPSGRRISSRRRWVDE